MSEITVYKLDGSGREVWQYPATVLERAPDRIRLAADFNRDDMDLGYTTFARGDRFIETFYSDRWYNIFAVYTGEDGSLKGWYCNICRPAEISDTAVRCEDLTLDLWVTPDGESLVLDEVEFAASELSLEERTQGHEALWELRRLASLGELPR
jgi:protein associated with RNAse G/E